MIVRKSVAAWLALATVGVSIVAPQVRAGGDKVAFPENYAEGVIYTTVDRAVSAKPPTAGLENTRSFASITSRRRLSRRCARASRPRAAP